MHRHSYLSAFAMAKVDKINNPTKCFSNFLCEICNNLRTKIIVFFT